MGRPKQVPARGPLTKDEVDCSTYVGSKEHKAARWWGGMPGAWVDKNGVATRPKKELTTICPKVSVAERDIATSWVRSALGSGQLKFFEGDKTYPKHIWFMEDNGQYWFGFAINQILGTYKGYPITEAEKREAFD